MSSHKSQRHSKKRRPIGRYIGWSFVGLVGLILVVLLAIETPFFKSWLKGMVESTANDSLSARLEIDDLSGDLFAGVELGGVRLLQEADTILSVRSISVDWSPFDLLSGQLTINELHIDSVHVHIREDSVSGWNVANLTPPDTSSSVDSAASGPGLPFDIVLSRLLVTNSSIDLDTEMPDIPRRVRDFRLVLSAMIMNDSQTVVLDSTSFTTEQPDLRLAQLGFRVYRDSANVRVSDFVIETRQNRIDARGRFHEPTDVESTAQLKSAPFHPEEFSFVLPLAKLGVAPVIDLDANLFHDTLEFNLLLDSDTSSVRVTGRLLNLFGSKSAPPAYQVSTDLENVHVAQWLADSTLDYTLNGWIRANGQGTDPDSIVATVTAGLARTNVAGYHLDTASLTVDYHRGDAQVAAGVESDFGRIDVSGSVKDVLHSRRYDLNAELVDFNLAAALDDTLYRSDVTAHMKLSGELASMPPPQTSVKLYVKPSTFAGYSMDTLAFVGDILDSTIHLDTLAVRSSFIDVSAGGTVELAGSIDIGYRVELIRPGELAKLIGADSLTVGGYIEGRAGGTIDSLSVSAHVALRQLQYNALHLDSLSGDITADRVDSTLRFGGTMSGSRFAGMNMLIDTMNATFESDGSHYQFDVYAARVDSLQASLTGTLSLDSLVTAQFSQLRLNIRGNEWNSGDTAVSIVYGNDAVRVENFRLTAAQNGDQEIVVDGVYRFTDSSDVRLDIQHLNLSAIDALLKNETMFAGDFSANLRFIGTTDSPILRGKFNILDGVLNEYSFKELSGDIDFGGDRLDAVTLLRTNSNDSLSVSASLPITMTPEDGDYVNYHDSVQVDVEWHRLPLSVLAATGHSFDNLSGQINGSLRLYNTLASPLLAGNLAVVDGNIEMPEYGVYYRNLSAGLRFDTTRMEVDSIVAHTEDGSMRIDGFLNFDSTLLSGHFRERRLQLRADNFFALKEKDYEIKISGSAEAEGDAEKSNFSGDITVNRSNFWLPAFTKETGAGGTEGTPLLVKAIGDTVMTADSTQADQQLEVSADSLMQWFDNLRGRITVKFPRNTWLRSPDMRIEIQGQLDVVKQAEYFELFGSISVVRGHYEVFGKRFTFKDGTLTFDGGEQPNPRIDLTAEYYFRDEARERHTVTLHATGRAFSPEVQFDLDGSDISQGDAAAYIVFGRPLDQLTQGQRSAVASSGGSSEGKVAGRLVANLLANELSKTIGSSLNLDVIEIKASENLSGAAFVVGKYITDRLFLSYQRGVGVDTNDELAPEIVTIELQLTRVLFLQAIEGDSKESGFDAILKFHE